MSEDAKINIIFGIIMMVIGLLEVWLVKWSADKLAAAAAAAGGTQAHCRCDHADSSIAAQTQAMSQIGGVEVVDLEAGLADYTGQLHDDVGGVDVDVASVEGGMLAIGATGAAASEVHSLDHMPGSWPVV
jgi:hypothetical protein